MIGDMAFAISSLSGSVFVLAGALLHRLRQAAVPVVRPPRTGTGADDGSSDRR